MICAAIERCAGIDVGKTFLAVCLMTGPLEGEPRVERRRFGTVTAGPMTGIQFITDAKGRKTAAVIDLKKHRALWEDI